MRNFLPVSVILIFTGLLLFTANSCKKSDTADLASKEDLVLGRWYISRIQLKIYDNSGNFLRDTIIPPKPKPENFVIFGTDGSFEYRYNTSVSEFGDYSFSGADSVIANSDAHLFHWKILTLTKDLFTVVTRSHSDPYYPGADVENFKTFIRYK